MSIKSILLHLANDGHPTARIAVAARLAERFSAHVEALYIPTPVSMPATVTGRGASFAYIAEATAIAHEKAEQAEREVQEMLKDRPHGWSIADGDHIELLAARSAFYDLVVVSQARLDGMDDVVLLNVPERLPLETSCPTLVVPYDQDPTAPVGDTVLVAWKNSREANRALRDAMPLLEAAKKVFLLAPDEETAAAEELIVHLRRHGMSVQRAGNTRRGGDVGERILDCARDVGADLLVMGSYGHSRLREMVLGGATRTVLEQMHLPTLLSH